MKTNVLNFDQMELLHGGQKIDSTGITADYSGSQPGSYLDMTLSTGNANLYSVGISYSLSSYSSNIGPSYGLDSYDASGE